MTEIFLAAAVTLVGVVLTTWAVLVHAALAVAPGALLITVGGAWVGNALARHGVRLFPQPAADNPEEHS